MADGNGSYVHAPSTLLLATHCAACGRPLRDAESVEASMGPDCREKFAALEPGEPSWGAAERLLSAAGVELPAGWGSDARKACNVLVHVAALRQRELPLAVAAAIRALGFERLGARLEERLREEATIVVVREGDELLVSSPYSPEFVSASHTVRGQRWDRIKKVRRFPASERVALWGALKQAYPAGTLVRCGDKIAAI